jgi:Ribbon-helix-helix protein, copG family.
MRIVTVKLPESYLEGIDELVKLGRFASRSDAIRTAVRELLRRELWLQRPRPRKKRHSVEVKVVE